jgi:transcriptional regulator with XRE-family HTH domain
MLSMSCRIRRLRANAKLSQSELANLVGVKRSAVAQWESETGTHPSVEHLSKLAVATGVTFEWLATGRGPDTSNSIEADSTALSSDFAQDLIESRVLELVRRLPAKKQLIACKLIEALIDT